MVKEEEEEEEEEEGEEKEGEEEEEGEGEEESCSVIAILTSSAVFGSLERLLSSVGQMKQQESWQQTG